MAFADKYQVFFNDLYGLEWEIDFQEDSFAGTVTELTATGSPLTLEYTSDSDEFYQPLRPSKAIVNVYSFTDFALTDFYSDQDFRLKTIIKCEGNIKWQGFVTTSEYSEPYDCAPYPVTITSIDGLSYLKNI